MVIAINVTDNKQKKALLLNYISEETYEVYEDFATAAEEEMYEDVITLFNEHFPPKSNITYEQNFLPNFNWISDEKIQQFYISVRQPALKWDFEKKVIKTVR